MDTIFIERLSIKGKHGVLPMEREVEQEFLIDIRAEFDTKQAGQSDALGDTLDYGAFRSVAQEVVAENSFYLIERLAVRIAERILEDARITAVSITIRKPAVFPDAIPGIQITRKRV